MNDIFLRPMTFLPKLALFLLGLYSPAVLAAAEPADVTVQALPFSKTLVPGQNYELALVFTMENGWHTYWDNPGEAGIPTTFDWTLPPGFSVASMQEPVPTRLVEDGITTFIHEDEAIYLFQIHTPVELPDTVQFQVKIDWLECKSICRAGSAELTFSSPGYDMEHPPVATKQMQQRSRPLYAAPSEHFQGNITRRGDQVIVNAKAFVQKGFKISDVDFFPYDELIYDISQKPELRSRFGSQKIRIALLPGLEQAPEALHGVLKITRGSGDTRSISNILVNETIE